MGWYRLVWVIGKPTRIDGPFMFKAQATVNFYDGFEDMRVQIKWFWKKPRIGEVE